MVMLEEGKRPWMLLEFLTTGPKTIHEITAHLGMKPRQMMAEKYFGDPDKPYDPNMKWPYKRYTYYPSWPALRTRLRGKCLSPFENQYPELMKYNRHTRKYTITRAGRRAIRI